MRLDLTLEMGRPQAVIQQELHEKKYRNARFALSREKGRRRVMIRKS